LGRRPPDLAQQVLGVGDFAVERTQPPVKIGFLANEWQYFGGIRHRCLAHLHSFPSSGTPNVIGESDGSHRLPRRTWSRMIPVANATRPKVPNCRPGHSRPYPRAERRHFFAAASAFHLLIPASRSALVANPRIRTVMVSASAVPPKKRLADASSFSLYAFGSFPLPRTRAARAQSRTWCPASLLFRSPCMADASSTNPF